MWNMTAYDNFLVVLVTNFVSNEFNIYRFDESKLEDIVSFKILFTNKNPSEIIYSSS